MKKTKRTDHCFDAKEFAKKVDAAAKRRGVVFDSAPRQSMRATARRGKTLHDRNLAQRTALRNSHDKEMRAILGQEGVYGAWN